MNNIAPISSVSFNGLIINGTVADKNVKKLGEFASQIENINFIKDLEKDFGVDAVLNNEITQMSFSHKKYGNLSEKFGCGSYPLGNVFRDITLVIRDIKTSVHKAAKEWEKHVADKDAVRRGC